MTAETPLISIITVVFNGGAYLEQTIRSVIDARKDDLENELEYIVIDGGSTDNTLDIIKKYGKQIDHWTSEPDKGIYDAMNKGIKKATGQYIGLLNADDWYQPGILQQVKDKINAPSTGENNQRVLYCDHYEHDDELDHDKVKQCTSQMKYWRGMTISHQAMFISAPVYSQLGFYDLDYKWASDYEFFLRMIKAGVTFQKLDAYGVNFRKGGSSTQHMNRSISEVSRIVRKYFGVFSKIYLLFLLTNRLPSMIANVRLALSKIIGKNATAKLRRAWHKIK